MQNVFDNSKVYRLPLWGHSFNEAVEPQLTGSFAADTVECDGFFGGLTEYAVFTVAEPVDHAFSPAWVGTYRIPMTKIRECPPVEVS